MRLILNLTLELFTISRTPEAKPRRIRLIKQLHYTNINAWIHLNDIECILLTLQGLNRNYHYY